jgi:transcription antitermination factor NusG
MFLRWRKLPKHLAKTHGKSKELISSVLFPCYIFVRVSNIGELAAVAGLRDVFGFISTEAGPCFASDKPIQSLRDQELLGLNDATDKGNSLRNSERLSNMVNGLKKLDLFDYLGKKVYLKEGPFKGASGIVEAYSDNDGTVEFCMGAVTFRAEVQHVAAI